MKAKSLAVKNHYLKQVQSSKMIALNLATSTAVETGKSVSIYVERYLAAKTANRHPPKTT